MRPGGLGRRPPTDDEHIRKYPLQALDWATPPVTEVVLDLPHYRAAYDQGTEGACVGFASTWAMSLLNRRRYVPDWLYQEARRVDEWPGEDYDGTSVRAGMDVLRTVGHVRFRKSGLLLPDVTEGINENRWARTTEEVVSALALRIPVVLGVNWYAAMDDPVSIGGDRGGREWWIGMTGDLGRLRGGHAICCYGASDRREAVKLVNSWGTDWPPVWLPYAVLDRLLREDGEGGVIVDR